MDDDAAGVEVAVKDALGVELPEPGGGLRAELENTPVVVVVVAVEGALPQMKPLLARFVLRAVIDQREKPQSAFAEVRQRVGFQTIRHELPFAEAEPLEVLEHCLDVAREV